MIKELALATLISATSTPRIIVPTIGVQQSIDLVVKVHEAVCKKLETPKEECVRQLNAEFLHIRRYVDPFCATQKDPDTCINE
jgi:hypothetical protein